MKHILHETLFVEIELKFGMQHFELCLIVINIDDGSTVISIVDEWPPAHVTELIGLLKNLQDKDAHKRRCWKPIKAHLNQHLNSIYTNCAQGVLGSDLFSCVWGEKLTDAPIHAYVNLVSASIAESHKCFFLAHFFTHIIDYTSLFIIQSKSGPKKKKIFSVMISFSFQSMKMIIGSLWLYN